MFLYGAVDVEIELFKDGSLDLMQDIPMGF
jgi:hypothetical protein